MRAVPPRRIAPVAATVCVLHALLLGWVFSQRFRLDATTPNAPVMSARWIKQVLMEERTQERPQERVPPAHPLPGRVAASRAQGGAEPAAAPQAAPPVLPSSEGAEVAPEPALRADSVQRAVRESARRKGLAARVDEQLGQAPVTVQEALQQGMSSAARSDCLKGGEGGYANSGMGLLALPLLVIDAASGNCRK